MGENQAELRATHFVTVFEGNPAEAQVLQTVLQSHGFDVVVANHTIKTVDPFITGPGMFDMTLQVPQEQIADAATVLAEARAEKGPEKTEGEAEGGEDADAGTQEATDDTAWDGESAGRRLRWGAVVLGFGALLPPLAILGILIYAFYFIDYNVRSGRLESPPSQHGMTKASALLVAAWTVVVVMILLGQR